MGEVYKARDTRLGRDVAIKVLPQHLTENPELRQRFEREARTISQLHHPHVCTVHDVGSEQGVDYLVMEYLEGETLEHRLRKGALAVAEVLGLGGQIAEAIEAAHRRGVVHRDLKPGNVMLTASGAKVLDFGLAREIVPREATTDTRAETLQAAITEEGTLVGTMPYMAPEQLRGKPADVRTDLWALGCVLYEMATGERPFRGESRADLMSAILVSQPEPPTRKQPLAPERLDGVVKRCLEKDPERRWQSARDVAIELEEISSAASTPRSATSLAAAPRRGMAGRRTLLAGAALTVVAAAAVFAAWRLLGPMEDRASSPGPIRSLAVLPLENLSGDPEQEYFADGMTEALIADLGKIGSLRVISRTSVMQYKNARKPLPEIARELGVDGVIEGTVTREGERVRITAQLVDGRTDQHLWAERYERPVRGVLDLQGEVAKAVAQQIRLELSPSERAGLENRRPVDPAAHDALLKGLYQFGRFNARVDAQRDYVLRACDRARSRLRAGARLAGASLVLADGSLSAAAPHLEGMPKAKAAALRALELDDTLAEAHTILGTVALVFDWDWPASERYLRRALELNPSFPRAHFWYGYHLGTRGRHEEAIAEARRAVELAPLDLLARTVLAEQLVYARRYDDALQEARKVLDMDPTFKRAFTLPRVGLRSARPIRGSNRCATRVRDP